MRKLLFSLVLVFLLPSDAHAWFWGDKSYEECMLSQMKGQSQSMYQIVDKVCSKRFFREVALSSYEVTITFSVDGLRAELDATSKEYNVTRLSARFAKKPCKEVTDSDWSIFREVGIKNGSGSVIVPELAGALPLSSCIQTREYFGTYK